MTTSGQEGGLLEPVSPESPGADDLGENLEAFRGYLKRVADHGLGRSLSAKVGASDLVQDTFLQARRKLSSYRGRTTVEWMSWLEAIMRNRLANVRRHYMDTDRRRVDREISISPVGADTQYGPDPGLADTLNSPGAQAVQHEREIALRKAIEELPERYRQVVRGHHEEGLSFEALAERLGVSPGVVKRLWGKALLRLRKS
ncbi:MAG: RNA polymerase sigma factor, partial [Isosphaeraceae bacterium]